MRKIGIAMVLCGVVVALLGGYAYVTCAESVEGVYVLDSDPDIYMNVGCDPNRFGIRSYEVVGLVLGCGMWEQTGSRVTFNERDGIVATYTFDGHGLTPVEGCDSWYDGANWTMTQRGWD